MEAEPASKRRKLRAKFTDDDEHSIHSGTSAVQSASSIDVSLIDEDHESDLLLAPISPPQTSRSAQASGTGSTNSVTSHNILQKLEDPLSNLSISSPIQLSYVEGLSLSNNIDTVSLKDIVGDPLIKECWAFNYLIDVDFLMSKFDEDMRDIVQVKVVHGSWKREDSNKLYIDEAAGRHSNVQAITAYMPEAFGTHHSKMILLIRHDDSAQVVIFTANLVPGDWRMCQAVWRSPLLPLQPTSSSSNGPAPLPSIGSGARFKHDLLAYFGAYSSKLKSLTAQLHTYDFSAVRAALVASTPSRQNLRTTDPEQETLWGWPGLKNILQHIPCRSTPESRIAMQVSSVASLGKDDKWLRGTFQEALSATSSTTKAKPKFSLIFPTADEIRRSLDGYGSGGSIHMKTQSDAQAKQLNVLRPMLCHWADDKESLTQSQVESSTSTKSIREAGRRRAAPHIKTYIRFTDEFMTSIDWAMVTSANLSTQAWGAATNTLGEVRVCSYEIGVVVWPALWDDDASQGATEMVPVFKKDLPNDDDAAVVTDGAEIGKRRIGMRMPYDLPLVPYTRDDVPWCATEPDSTPDWMGRVWPGFGAR